MIERWLTATRNSINLNEYFIVTAKVTPADGYSIEEVASKIAQGISLGSEEPLEYEDIEDRRAASAKILSCKNGQIEIAFPRSIAGYREGIPQLFSAVYFPAEYKYVDSYFLENIQMPTPFQEALPGPKYGKAGIRETFGVTGRPLLGVVNKPRLGVSRETIAENCRLALEGGADFVVDDELIVDPDNTMNFHDRLESFVKIANEAENATGEPKAYVPNITADPSQMRQYAEQAEDAGADAVVLNAFTIGFPAMRKLRNSPNFDLPIINTNIGEGILTRYLKSGGEKGTTGVSKKIIRKLSRLYGADAVHIGTAMSETYEEDAAGLRTSPIDVSNSDRKEPIPVVAGGLDIDNISVNIQSFGTDTIFEAGRGILAYHSGPKDGATALRAFIEEIAPSMSDKERRKKIIDIANRHSHVSETIDSIPDPVA